MLADESFWVAVVGSVQDLGADSADLFGVSVVDGVRGVPGDAGVPVLGVVPGEEALAERPRLEQAGERFGELGPVLQRPELRLGVRIVVAGMRP